MSQKRYPELTVMSGIAIIFVLIIHACGSCLGYLYPNMNYAEADAFLRTLNNLVTPAVPMFLFASGYKYAIHDTNTPYWTFLRKRLPRVLMSFLIINTFFWTIDSIIWMDHFDPLLLLKTYISSWMGNTVAYPLWYIPMYCCVIVLCPLVCRAVQKSWIRFLLYLAIGSIQRLLSVQFSLLGEYPVSFFSYFTFFELGIIAHEYGFSKRNTGQIWLVAFYIGVVFALSIVVPELSKAECIQYWLYCICGTLAYYSICIFLNENKLLSWLGSYSYPLFLLHEPIIGRFVGTLVKIAGVKTSIDYVILWTLGTFTLTILLIKLFELLRLDSMLWKFSLKRVVNQSNERM